MEIGSSPGNCVDYDLAGGRIFVVVPDAERTEINVRPQVHRLVRHMAQRNAESGGSPVLCSTDELMEAVWQGEPMHTRTELARLVWELRRQLEPLGATDVVVNEPRRGYRLVTCPAAAAQVEPAPGESTRVPRHRRSLALALALLVAAALMVGVAVAVVVTRGSGGGSTTEETTGAAEAAFVDRLQNVLRQSASGRREIRAALAAGFGCRISPEEAARRISSVADNRQSILEQLGTLQAPTPATEHAVTLLQRALQLSIEADRHYRDGFLEIQAGTRCPLPTNPSFRLAARSDALATEAKRRFVDAFNPIVRRAGRPIWSAGGF
jgi:DNA-binding winged helix-turn-helix (wHTH) protein